MLLERTYQKFMIFFSFLYIVAAADEGDWSYTNQSAWGGQCNTGKRQSPIRLNAKTSYLTKSPLLDLKFENYNTALRGPLTIVNNGKTVNLVLTVTTAGKRPAIHNRLNFSTYEVQSVHFHWGSPDSKGSEHVINGRRFDVEMHIVHKNPRYATVAEAAEHSDGLAVLGVMFRKADDPNRTYPGLEKILNALPELENYESEASIEGELEVGQLLGDLNTKRFFLYQGSLTTPPCSEAVVWYVFPEALPIPGEQIAKFWEIRDKNNTYLHDNFRELQDRNGRTVLYKSNH